MTAEEILYCWPREGVTPATVYSPQKIVKVDKYGFEKSDPGCNPQWELRGSKLIIYPMTWHLQPEKNKKP